MMCFLYVQFAPVLCMYMRMCIRYVCVHVHVHEQSCAYYVMYMYMYMEFRHTVIRMSVIRLHTIYMYSMCQKQYYRYHNGYVHVYTFKVPSRYPQSTAKEYPQSIYCEVLYSYVPSKYHRRYGIVPSQVYTKCSYSRSTAYLIF